MAAAARPECGALKSYFHSRFRPKTAPFSITYVSIFPKLGQDTWGNTFLPPRPKPCCSGNCARAREARR